MINSMVFFSYFFLDDLICAASSAFQLNNYDLLFECKFFRQLLFHFFILFFFFKTLIKRVAVGTAQLALKYRTFCVVPVQIQSQTTSPSPVNDRVLR